jgi:hypothetical protein
MHGFSFDGAKIAAKNVIGSDDIISSDWAIGQEVTRCDVLEVARAWIHNDVLYLPCS